MDALVSARKSTELYPLEREFHLKIAQFAHCARLEEEISNLGILDLIFPVSIQPAWRAHRLIVNALEARDPECADREMRAHVRGGLRDALASVRDADGKHACGCK